MKSKIYTTAMLLAMLLAVNGLSAQPILGYSDFYMFNTKYKITGIITDANTGLPIEGAMVDAITYTSLPSNQDGVYRLLVPPGLGYFLEFTAAGHVPYEMSNINISMDNPEVIINVQLSPLFNYLDYRVVTLPLVPNPLIIEVPEGATGYAWFLLEGKVSDQLWMPVPSSTVQVIDGQGNHVYDKDGSPIMTNRFSYKFLTTYFNTQHTGIFGVPVESGMIQNGSIGSQEIFTVIEANGQPISTGNRQSFYAKVVMFKYTQSWGFRYYGKVGAGAGTAATKGIAKANAFIGGGSGATIQLKHEGLDNNPEWSLFQIHRKDDLFAGAQISIGPPSLMVTDVGIGGGTKRSFSYQKEYEFNMNDMDPLEAPLAFYLFYEPGILYAPKPIGGQIAVLFLSGLVQHLINNSATYGLTVARVADEAGLDLEGSMNLSVGIGFDALESLQLSLGPSLGVHAHIGGTTRKTADNYRYNKLYVGGGYDAGINFGLKNLNTASFKTELFYPSMLKNKMLPSKLDLEFSSTGKFQNLSWKSTKLEASLESSSPLLNIYNLSGATQKYTAWIDFETEGVKNLFISSSPVISQAMNIGKSAVNLGVNNNTFNQDLSGFLEEVYTMQENNPVILDYGHSATDKNSFNADLTLQFPLPVFPAIDIVIGGGFDYTREHKYDLSHGKWAKGLPYLQSEMPDPPKSNITFGDVMNQLWQKFLEDPYVQGLVSILEEFINNISFSWVAKEGSSQVIVLNDIGSMIEIRANSIPADIDSVLCRQWDWAEEPTSKMRDSEKISAYRNYAKTLRTIREEAAGMKYGIGGFYRFEPLWETFGDSTYLTIAYTEDEISGIDVLSLGMYWEDSLGVWHPVQSFIEPDSNRVSAWIDHFTTYTLAPRMPYGNYGLISVPDSIEASCSSVALISSPLLYNNDSTMIVDGTLFTIEASRGLIMTADANEELDGIQVIVQGGMIQFQIQADSIALPISLYANSVNGYARCEGELILFDTIPPNPPNNLMIIAGNGSVYLEWQGVSVADIAGYKIYYDTDTIPPFNGVHTAYGHPSPIKIGNQTFRNITGLFNDTTYYFAVSAYDISGNESQLSPFISATPIDIATFLPLSTIVIYGNMDTCFSATQNIIVSDFVVESGSLVTLIAGENINILPGTLIENGCHFAATIAKNNIYCHNRLSYDFSTNKDTYTVGETIYMNMSITNQTDLDVIKLFNYQGCEFLYYIIDHYPDFWFCLPMMSHVLMPANQTIDFLQQHSASDYFLNQGEYLIKGVFGDYYSSQKVISVIDAINKESDIIDVIASNTGNSLFKVFPNPTTDSFILELHRAGVEATITASIFSMMGEMLLHTELPSQNLHEFTLSNHPEGIYIIRVIAGDKMGVKKLIKQ